jgi:hypothetical protein
MADQEAMVGREQVRVPNIPPVDDANDVESLLACMGYLYLDDDDDDAYRRFDEEITNDVIVNLFNPERTSTRVSQKRRQRKSRARWTIKIPSHPIVAVMLGGKRKARKRGART